jgi:alkylated DNA repair dioxygenase AlkB
VAVLPDGSRREVPQGRLMTWAGDEAYRYSGITLEPRPLVGPLAELTERLNDELSAGFNHVVLNLYRDGSDHVGRHADCETQLGYEPLIASLSLGAERRFVIEPKGKGRRWRKTLGNGSLLVMSGSLQHRFRHSLPRQPSVTEPRINVTWRRMLGPPGMSRGPRRGSGMGPALGEGKPGEP